MSRTRILELASPQVDFQIVTPDRADLSCLEYGKLAKQIASWPNPPINNFLLPGFISQVVNEVMTNRCFLAREGDQIVGYAAMGPVWVEALADRRVSCFWLNKLMIAPDFVNTPLAASLLTQIGELNATGYVVFTTPEQQMAATAAAQGWLYPRREEESSPLIAITETLASIARIEGCHGPDPTVPFDRQHVLIRAPASDPC